MSLTITDMFCGAGGSSTGAIQVPGIEVRTALNHWDLAIETHNSNHPDADHIQADISQTDPRYVRRSDILWASPECTNHSRAKGKKKATTQASLLFDDEKPLPDEAADRSRATMWDVLRFAEVHHYAAMIVENVVEVVDWVFYPAWRAGLEGGCLMPKLYGQCMPGGSLSVPGIPTPTTPIGRPGRDALTLMANRPERTVATVAEPSPRDLRAWAVSNGFRINTRGAIPAQIRDAYERARTSPEEGPSA